MPDEHVSHGTWSHSHDRIFDKSQRAFCDHVHTRPACHAPAPEYFAPPVATSTVNPVTSHTPCASRRFRPGTCFSWGIARPARARPTGISDAQSGHRNCSPKRPSSSPRSRPDPRDAQASVAASLVRRCLAKPQQEVQGHLGHVLDSRQMGGTREWHVGDLARSPCTLQCETSCDDMCLHLHAALARCARRNCSH